MMKNVLKCLLVFAVVFGFGVKVNAATKQDVIDYLKAEHEVNGDILVVEESNYPTIDRYFENLTLSDSECQAIIDKLNAIIDILNAEGVTMPEYLSKAKKQEVFNLGSEAAAITGGTLEYDKTNKQVILYKDGEKVGVIPTIVRYDEATGRYVIGYRIAKKTGVDYTVYVAISGIVVALGVVSIFRKLRTNE